MRNVRRILAAVAVALMAACSPIVTVHGYVPPDSDLAEIRPGETTRDEVEDALGRPSSTALVDGSDWYYVQSRREQVALFPPRTVDREIVAVGFDDAGVVTDVSRYGLEDGRIVDLSPRVTPSGGQRRNALIALFGGLLNFDAENLFGDN